MRIRISNGADTILDFEAPDDPRLADFDKHQKTLLDMLRDEYERRGPKPKPFEADKAWRSLTGLARSYFGRGSVKQATMPAADRIERLRDIAKILRRARRLLERTTQTEVGDYLFSAWWEGSGSEYANADGSFDPRYMERKFKKLVNGLAVLEAAASNGADHVVRPKRGRPAVLPWDDVWNLAALYRDSTGSIPGASDGPFAKFVMKFLIAAGRPDDIEYDSIVEAIKGARRWALMHPVARKWGPSPFDEEA
jgi:hypothetical protein